MALSRLETKVKAGCQQIVEEAKSLDHINDIKEVNLMSEYIIRKLNVIKNARNFLKLSRESEFKLEVLILRQEDNLNPAKLDLSAYASFGDFWRFWRKDQGGFFTYREIVELYCDPLLRRNEEDYESKLEVLGQWIDQYQAEMRRKKDKTLQKEAIDELTKFEAEIAEISGKPTESVLVAKIDKLQAQGEALTAQVALLTRQLGAANEVKVPASVAAGALRLRLTTFSPQSAPQPQPSAAPVPAIVAKKSN